MSFTGHIKNGVVVFNGPVSIPEGSEVRVEAVTETGSGTLEGEDPRTLNDVLKDIIGKVRGLPPDFSVNHDHYLYGTPKQQP